jgi:hypothetical protein
LPQPGFQVGDVTFDLRAVGLLLEPVERVFR